MTTPDCKGVTVKDLLLAYTMESVAKDVENKSVDSVCETTKVRVSQLLNEWNSNYTKTEEIIQSF
jgi:4a-hydroxytetrahydrobiopterin dehydratase